MAITTRAICDICGGECAGRLIPAYGGIKERIVYANISINFSCGRNAERINEVCPACACKVRDYIYELKKQNK